MAAPKSRTAATTPPAPASPISQVDVFTALIDCRKSIKALAALLERPLSERSAEDVEWTLSATLATMRKLMGHNG